ncbi:type VII secretion target [Streptomyces sp. URMC 123]|uniref:type VII secretion target n=1 Tax=Streptomyces sp. URMC 123 TaxID=3423403 RepID=UPI003F1DC189
MNLRVTPPDLEGFADLLRRAADDADAARSYTAKFGTVSRGSQGLLTRIIDLHADLESDVSGTFRRLRALLSSAAGELDQAARYYREADLRQATAMDAAAPRYERKASRELF